MARPRPGGLDTFKRAYHAPFGARWRIPISMIFSQGCNLELPV